MIIGPAGSLGGLGPIEPKDLESLESVDFRPLVPDHIEVSPAGALASEALSIDPVRHAKVEELKTDIASGAFETDAKIEAAVDRFLEGLI